MYNITPKTLFVGRKIIYLPSCHSTNDQAAVLVRDQKAWEGTLVVTGNQTAGRGQRGNQWETEAGKNLTFSLILKPAFLTANEQFRLNIAISLGIHEFINGYLSKTDTKIKWPNDLYHKGKKLGGVLIENSLKKYALESSIIGIGLNVNQTQFREAKAISMKTASGQTDDYDLERLLTALAETLESNYLLLRSGAWEMIKSRYLNHLYWYQEDHIFCHDHQYFNGRIVGVDAAGRLALDLGQTLRYFNLKEITFIE